METQRQSILIHSNRKYKNLLYDIITHPTISGEVMEMVTNGDLCTIVCEAEPVEKLIAAAKPYCTSIHGSYIQQDKSV